MDAAARAYDMLIALEDVHDKAPPPAPRMRRGSGRTQSSHEAPSEEAAHDTNTHDMHDHDTILPFLAVRSNGALVLSEQTREAAASYLSHSFFQAPHLHEQPPQEPIDPCGMLARLRAWIAEEPLHAGSQEEATGPAEDGEGAM